MENEIRRDGQTLSLANWQTEIRAAPNLKISGKIFTNSISQDMGDWFEKIRPGAFKNSIRNRNIYLLWPVLASVWRSDGRLCTFFGSAV